MKFRNNNFHRGRSFFFFNKIYCISIFQSKLPLYLIDGMTNIILYHVPYRKKKKFEARNVIAC